PAAPPLGVVDLPELPLVELTAGKLPGCPQQRLREGVVVVDPAPHVHHDHVDVVVFIQVGHRRGMSTQRTGRPEAELAAAPLQGYDPFRRTYEGQGQNRAEEVEAGVDIHHAYHAQGPEEDADDRWTHEGA